MSILIGLIPALAWGLQPIVATRMGGKPANQILGTTAGTFIVACIVLAAMRPDIPSKAFAVSALSGALWVVGQIGQFHAFTRIGVSRTMPVSSGLQLVGTSLIGVFFFSEWPSLNAKLIGFAALTAVIIGIGLTSVRKSGEAEPFDKRALLILFLTNFGYLAFSSIPKLAGQAGAEGTAVFFPQALGMLLGAVAYVVLSGKSRVFREPESWKNLLTGLTFSVAALSYIISAQLNGIATGFTLSQLSVVISTLLGIFLLKESKTPLELRLTIIGLILILAGGITTAFV